MDDGSIVVPLSESYLPSETKKKSMIEGMKKNFRFVEFSFHFSFYMPSFTSNALVLSSVHEIYMF